MTYSSSLPYTLTYTGNLIFIYLPTLVCCYTPNLTLIPCFAPSPTMREMGEVGESKKERKVIGKREGARRREEG